MPENQRRFKVFQVVNSLAPAGAEHLTTDLARALDPKIFDVHVVVVREGSLRGRVEEAGLPVVVTGYSFDHTAPLVITRMVAYFRREHPDLVHTHLLGSDIVGRLAALLSGTPIIVSTQHDSKRWPWYYERYRRMSSQLVDCTVACSPSVAGFCEEAIGLSEERVATIPNGVDIDLFDSGYSEMDEHVVFGAVGTIIPVKGHDILVRAFARVLEEMPDATLRIAGDGEGMQGLKKLTDDLGCTDSVEFLGRIKDIPEFLRGIDVLIHPSREEGLPLAVLEGMAAHKPVIASDIPALADVLGHGEVGVLFPVNDDAALATEMTRIAGDREEAERLGKAGRKEVVENYSLDTTVETYTELYMRLLREEGLVDEDGLRVTERPRRHKSRFAWTQRALQVLLLLTVGYFVTRSLVAGFNESGFAGLEFSAPHLLASVAVLLLYYGLFSGGFWLLLQATGEKIQFRDSFKLSFVSSLGKYVPGGFWPVASRMALSPRVGIRRHRMLVASALESAVSVTGGFLVLLLALVSGLSAPGQVTWMAGTAAVGAAVVLLYPSVLSRLAGWIMRLLFVEGEVPHVPFLPALGLILYYMLTWLVGGWAFYLFTSSLVSDPPGSVITYAGYFAAGAIVGLLVLFAPGGLGAREGALLVLLTGPLGATNAAVITLASRVWTSIVELLLSVVAVIMPYAKRRERQIDTESQTQAQAQADEA